MWRRVGGRGREEGGGWEGGWREWGGGGGGGGWGGRGGEGGVCGGMVRVGRWGYVGVREAREMGRGVSIVKHIERQAERTSTAFQFIAERERKHAGKHRNPIGINDGTVCPPSDTDHPAGAMAIWGPEPLGNQDGSRDTLTDS